MMDGNYMSTVVGKTFLAGQWAMDNGQWTMDNGQWTMDNI
jgi:hypothetical protein